MPQNFSLAPLTNTQKKKQSLTVSSGFPEESLEGSQESSNGSVFKTCTFVGGFGFGEGLVQRPSIISYKKAFNLVGKSTTSQLGLQRDALTNVVAPWVKSLTVHLTSSYVSQ